MRVKIYQINLDRDQGHAAFWPLEDLKKLTGKNDVDPSLYGDLRPPAQPEPARGEADPRRDQLQG